MSIQNTDQSFSANLEQEVSSKLTPVLPRDVAHNYIHEMLVEMSQIAQGAQLKEVAALLRVTITAVEINGRFP
jgi:hypothetical protein